jgi:hypothetical protein
VGLGGLYHTVFVAAKHWAWWCSSVFAALSLAARAAAASAVHVVEPPPQGRRLAEKMLVEIVPEIPLGREGLAIGENAWCEIKVDLPPPACLPVGTPARFEV